MVEIDYSKLPECDLIVNHINARLKAMAGTNLFIIGLSGTGKSSASLRIGELIKNSRKDTETKIFIVGSLLELLEAIKGASMGDVIIIEEVSVLFPSRRAMTGENVAVGQIFDTIRKKCLCLISNCPIWNSVDSHMRGMGHILIETLRIDKKNQVVISKFHKLQTNPSSGKTYRHTFIRHGRDTNRLFTRMPSLTEWNRYETTKEKFMDSLYDMLKMKQKKKEEKTKKDLGITKPPVKELTAQELKVYHLIYKKGLRQEEVKNELGVSSSRVCNIVKNIKKKVDFFKEKPILNVKKVYPTPFNSN